VQDAYYDDAHRPGAQGLRFSDEVTHALSGIKAAVEDLARYSREIGAATQEQSTGSEQIKHAVTNLNGIIMEISSASEQQSKGAGQVVQAIERVKDMVQQGSSSSLELAASAEELHKQAGGLQSLVSRFSLNDQGSGIKDLKLGVAA
jgi:methyl-accepting chemotaxis protein